MKLSKEERLRIQMHLRVAPRIPEPRKFASLRGQLYIDFSTLAPNDQLPASGLTGAELKHADDHDIRSTATLHEPATLPGGTSND